MSDVVFLNTPYLLIWQLINFFFFLYFIFRKEDCFVTLILFALSEAGFTSLLILEGGSLYEASFILGIYLLLLLIKMKKKKKEYEL